MAAGAGRRGEEGNEMKPYYVSIKEELQDEEKFYAEELRKTHWQYLKEAGELFLIHAYLHLFKTSTADYEVFGDTNYKIKHGQFYLNLAVGLELLLKSILLKKGEKINRTLKKGTNSNLNPEKTSQNDQIKNDSANKNGATGANFLPEMTQYAPMNGDVHDQIKDNTQRCDTCDIK